MPNFQRDEFIDFIIKNEVVGFFDQPVKLRSGRESRWYVNWRTLTGDVYLSDKLTDFLIDFLEDAEFSFNIIYGVPDGATKLGLMSQFKWAQRQHDYGKGSHAFLMGRSSPKEHGVLADRMFLGNPRGKVVVVEDVTTTGGSLLKAIQVLKEVGADVVAAVGLTNRLERREDGKGVEGAVADLGVKYYALSDATELLPRAIHEREAGDDVKAAIEAEFAKYGMKELKL